MSQTGRPSRKVAAPGWHRDYIELQSSSSADEPVLRSQRITNVSQIGGSKNLDTSLAELASTMAAIHNPSLSIMSSDNSILVPQNEEAPESVSQSISEANRILAGDNNDGTIPYPAENQQHDPQHLLDLQQQLADEQCSIEVEQRLKRQQKRNEQIRKLLLEQQEDSQIDDETEIELQKQLTLELTNIEPQYRRNEQLLRQEKKRLEYQQEQLQSQQEAQTQPNHEEQLHREQEDQLEKQQEEQLQKQRQEQLQRQQEEQLQKQQEQLQKQRQEQFQRQQEEQFQTQQEQLQKQRQEPFQRQQEEQLQKQQEQLQNQRQEQFQRQQEEQFQKQQEQLQKQRQEQFQRERNEQLQKQRQEQFQRQREEQLQARRGLLNAGNEQLPEPFNTGHQSVEGISTQNLLSIVHRDQKAHEAYCKSEFRKIHQRFDKLTEIIEQALSTEFPLKPECLPFQHREAIEDFEHIRDDEYRQCVKYLGEFGGRTLDDTTNEILKNAITDSVSPFLTWTGREEGTLKLANTRLAKALYAATRMNTEIPKTKWIPFSDSMMVALKNSKQRNRTAQRRPPDDDPDQQPRRPGDPDRHGRVGVATARGQRRRGGVTSRQRRGIVPTHRQHGEIGPECNQRNVTNATMNISGSCEEEDVNMES